MKIIEYFSVKNDCYKANVNKADDRYTDFQTKGPRGLMLHSVGCPQPNAQVFANNWNRSGLSLAVHAVLQADGTVYHCLPWNFRGWHCGGSANNTHIGVEMTEPDCIAYISGASFTCSNFEKARAHAEATYKTAVELFAMLCKKYNLDPMTDIISHKEGYKKGLATNHGDPEHLWTQLKTGYTMDTFRKAVKAAMVAETDKAATTTGEAESGLYYVRVGVYSVKANAENMVAKLKAAGFDAIITTKGGEVVKETVVKKSVTEIAKEVIAGKWGAGADRKKRLTDAGYDYNAVQKKVNELLR